MPNKIEEIKNNVEKYQKIITKRDDLLKEYSSWDELYKELQDKLIEVRKIYEVSQSDEAKAVLDDWLKQEKDYLEVINEYKEKFDEINKEIDSYKNIDEQQEYLALITEHQRISKEMKEIERKSSDIAGGNIYSNPLGSNCIKIDNGEGREKYINEYFAEDYIKLRDTKKFIAKKMKSLYNKNITQVSEEQEVKGTSLVDESLDTLTKEEKIILLQEKMEKLRNSKGRKQRITYKGECIELPRAAVGEFLMCGGQLHKLEAELAKEKEEEIEFEPIPLEKAIVPVSEVKTFVPFELEEKEEEEKKGFFKILGIRKPKNVEKIKNTVKRVAVAIAASLVLVASTMPIIGKYIRKDNNKDIEKDVAIDVVLQPKPEPEEIPKHNNIKAPVNIESEKVLSSISVSLWDDIEVDMDAKIYDDMFDATLERNGFDRYYGNIPRRVGGIVVKYDGGLYMFYSNDPKSNHELDALLQNGGEITAVLAQNDYGLFEGYFNINDVKGLDPKLGGR